VEDNVIGKELLKKYPWVEPRERRLTRRRGYITCL